MRRVFGRLRWTRCSAATLVLIWSHSLTAGQITIDHTCTDITKVPEAAINQAKANLHIAYGHTSHGSQLTTGMTGLVAFANGGGLGLSLPNDIFAWNNGGTGGALDLHDQAMPGDVGYHPQWVNETKAYLDAPANADVNVIIWSWCGQVDNKYAAGTLDSEYLTPMSQLEADYPNVTFVYMTGHVDHWDDTNNKAANQAIRDYCATNNKVLYDFADIESYDPDGNYYPFPHDNCDYYESATGALQGNWATEWQNSHTEDVDWYNCSSAHSEPLNANLKAYAAWWLWARLGGWAGPSGPGDATGPAISGVAVDPDPASINPTVTATATDAQSTVAAAEFYVDTDPGIGNGTAMSASDGAFDETGEHLEGTIDIAPLGAGSHIVYVRARDSANNWTTPAVAGTFEVTDGGGGGGGGPNPDPAGEPLLVTKARISLRFNADGRDCVTARGTLSVANGYDPTGDQVQVNVGGIQRSFTLNAKGRAKNGNDAFSLRVKRNRDGGATQEAKFAFRMRRGNFSAALADEGLSNESVRDKPVSVLFGMTLGGTSYSGGQNATGNDPHQMRYKGKEGRCGKAGTSRR